MYVIPWGKMAGPGVYVFQPFKVMEVNYVGTDKPRARSGHRIVCDDVHIYCFGGYNPTVPVSTLQREFISWSPDRPLFKELWSFNIATRVWKQLKVVQNMPDELASNAMCMNGRNLMIFGGTGAPFGNKCSNDVITWRSGPGDVKLQILDVHGVRPPGQYGQAVLCYNEHLYAVGGTNGFAYNCDIYRLNLRTLGWEPVYIGTGQEGEPFGRYRHEVARVDDKLYIIGGGTGEWSFELMDVPMYDIKTKKWNILTAKADISDRDKVLPLPRKCHSAVQVDSPNGTQVFVAGGSDGQSVFDEIWRLNLADLQWTLMRKSVLPNPLYFHSGTVTPSGCMYLFGGIEPKQESSCRNNILYKVWVCIPKLSEICWEAMLHLCPNLEKYDRSTLLHNGIPVHFVDRLFPE